MNIPFELKAIRRRVSDNTSVVTIYLVLTTMVIVAASLSEAFRTPGNIFNILRQAVVLGLISLGQTFVILAGGIDLSVGSVVKLVSVLSAGLLDGREELTIPVIGFC